MLKVIVNCGLCEDFIGPCLQSLQMQSDPHWQALVTVDRRGDRTYERAAATAAGDDRIVITRNRTRLYTMENIVRAIRRSRAKPDDIIVILDGDDWFITDRALERIVHQYGDPDCWMTYGSWISNRRRAPGRWPAYPDGCDFRTAPWLGTAVRTWKKWLFDLIADEDLRDRRGRYFRVTEDVACMLPMLEMSTTRHARHIAEPLMLYNLLSHHDPERHLRYEGGRNLFDLRRRRRYPPLPHPVRRLTLDAPSVAVGIINGNRPRMKEASHG